MDYENSELSPEVGHPQISPTFLLLIEFKRLPAFCNFSRYLAAPFAIYQNRASGKLIADLQSEKAARP